MEIGSAEIPNGEVDYVDCHRGWATDSVGVVVAAIRRGIGYEEIEEGEDWEVHFEKFGRTCSTRKGSSAETGKKT